MYRLIVRKGRSLACVLACLALFPAAHATDLHDSEHDFLFLQLQQSLRNEPASPENTARYFALGEYQFELKNFDEAERFFRRADGKTSGMPALLTKVYLARIAGARDRRTQSVEARRLKQTLAGRHFFSVFGPDEKKQEVWTSLLKNRYTLDERVDRLEVYLNGSLFYTVSLP